MKGRRLTPEERAAWEQIARSVRPKSKRRRAAAPIPAKSSAESPQSGPKEAAPKAAAASPAEGKTWQAVPPRPVFHSRLHQLDRSGDSRAKRRQIAPTSRLDLHGLRYEEARLALARFLRAAQDRRETCVLIITGLGRPASLPTQLDEGAGLSRGVLNRSLPGWLAGATFKDIVSGFSAANRRHGGDGAFYVFLKARKN